MNSRLLILSLVFIFTFCSKSENIDKETAAKIYVEFLIIDETFPVKSDSIQIKKEIVLSDLGISLNEYNNVISELKDDKKEWQEFFRLSQEYLGDKKEKLTSDQTESQSQ